MHNNPGNHWITLDSLSGIDPSNIPSIMRAGSLWISFDDFLRIGKEPTNHQKLYTLENSRLEPKNGGSVQKIVPFQLGDS